MGQNLGTAVLCAALSVSGLASTHAETHRPDATS